MKEYHACVVVLSRRGLCIVQVLFKDTLLLDLVLVQKSLAACLCHLLALLIDLGVVVAVTLKQGGVDLRVYDRLR